jgi:poly(3-hydroxybutyrate) depolymerase
MGLRSGPEWLNSAVSALLAGLIVATVACAQSGSLAVRGGPELAPQEGQCMARGWQRVVLDVAELPRVLLWQAPARAWSKGAIIVLHGGGGQHYQWCVANAPIIAPQVAFSELALTQGFAVFLLNSSDRVTDTEGRLCGKVWDDEVRSRSNLDLPFLGDVIDVVIPRLRPEGSHPEVFLTGLSSGGYMTVRAATHFDDRVTAFAPVSSGDPYGWHRICQAGLTPRTTVHGIGLDNETGKHIIEPGACRSDSYSREKPWDSAHPVVKPAFRIFHHEMDGINDLSCTQKVDLLLRQHGYRGAPEFLLRGGSRSLANHLWQDEYNRPILDFFASQLDKK